MQLNIERRTALKLGAFTLLGGVCAFGIGRNLVDSVDEATDDDVSATPVESTEPVYGGTKNYLADKLGLIAAPLGAAGTGVVPTIRDTGITLRVKYQYVLAACTQEDETFTHMYSDIEYQGNAFYTQMESLQTLYVTANNDIVALIWPNAINGIRGTICDWIFAADNDNAEVIDTYDFDPVTGILQAHLDDLPEHLELQFQVMIRCDCQRDDITITPYVTIENNSSLRCVEDGPLTISTWDNVCEVPILEPGQNTLLAVDDLNLFLNGLDREICFGDRAEFDPMTGCLRFPLPAIGITEIRVRVNEPKLAAPLGASVAYATRLSRMGFWNWMASNLKWRGDLADAVTFNNTVHADKDNQIHPYLFNGYGFNIAHSTDVGANESTAVKNRLNSLISFATTNYTTYYAANIYTTLTGHANPKNGSGEIDPQYGTDYSEVLDPIRNSKSEIESFTSTLKARVDDELNGNSISGVANLPAVTHGMTLPSDSDSEPMYNSSNNPIDYYPVDNGTPNESWWNPIRNHNNGRNPVLVVSACTHAQTQSKFTSADNGIKHWNYRGAVLFRFLELNTTASQPYVVISFFTPRRPLENHDLSGANKIYGQAAVTVLKFPIDTTGTLKVKKITTGTDADPNLEFSFRVSFSGTGAPGDETFSLHNNEVKEINDLPVGIVATVSETTPSTYSATWDPSDRKATIVAGADNAVTVTCTNTRKVGALTIQKILEGASTDHQFKLNLKVYRPDNSVFLNEDFYLKHNQTKTFNNLPTEYRYEVTEYPEAHFRCLSIDNGTGTIVENTAQQARVIARNRENGYATVEKHLSM